MRFVVMLPLFVSSLATAGEPEEFTPEDEAFAAKMIATSKLIDKLVGVWNVVASPGALLQPRCASEPGTNAYQWIVSSRSDGTLSVVVQGETAFPKLTGFVLPVSSVPNGEGTVTLDASKVESSGTFATPGHDPAPLRVGAVSEFELDYVGGKLVGKRTYLGFTSGSAPDGGSMLVPQICTWSVTASR